MMSSPDLLSTIGNTPLIEIESPNPKVKILAKLEMLNPTASIKDRIAKYIIEKAKEEGLITDNTHVYEASSGNTGASIAMLCALYNLKCSIFVPEKTSIEKINMIKSYGAQIEIIKTQSNQKYEDAARLAAEKDPNAYFVDQYNNPWNLEAHYHTTAKEIWQQTEGNIDYIVATSSTGGTLCGIAKYLKEQNLKVKSVLADPVGSIYQDFFLNKKNYQDSAKPYLVEGAGKHYIVDVIDFSLIDDAISFSDQQAFNTAISLCNNAGLCVGGSSGGNIYASYQLAKKLQTPTTIVTLCPDSGLKYLSKFYNSKWLKDNLKE